MNPNQKFLFTIQNSVWNFKWSLFEEQENDLTKQENWLPMPVRSQLWFC